MTNLEVKFDSTEVGSLARFSLPGSLSDRAARLDQFPVGDDETGRRSKFYTLTKAGSKQLTAEEESWERLALAIANVRDVRN